MDTKDLIKILGIMPKVKGYYYINDAVALIRNYEGMPVLITKDIYPSIAMKYHTSTQCVEHAIRTSISRAWLNNKKVMNRIAGYSMRFKPSNKEFLFMLVDYLETSEHDAGALDAEIL